MTINILKLGGGVGVEHSRALRNLAARIQRGERWLLVHGASAATNALAEQVGCPVQTITSPGGHTSRYTDARMIEIYCAAAASVNQQIGAELAALGVQAAGLAGPTVIAAQRKQAIRAIQHGRPVVIRDDYSGTITGIEAGLLLALLDAGWTPVLAPVALGDGGERLNVDGDLVAAAAARTVGAETLIILSNVPGLLRDPGDPATLIPRIDWRELAAYEPLAEGRMKKKLLAAQQAGAARTILADARVDSPLDAALSGAGTQILREVRHVETTG